MYKKFQIHLSFEIVMNVIKIVVGEKAITI